MAKKKQTEHPAVDGERLLSDMCSADEEVRGEAVRSLCPCHAGWEAFERHVSVVLRAAHDPSRAVRLHALHVFDDAARMQHASEFDYYLQEAVERVRRKRPSPFRPAEAAAAEKRRARVRRTRGRH